MVQDDAFENRSRTCVDVIIRQKLRDRGLVNGFPLVAVQVVNGCLDDRIAREGRVLRDLSPVVIFHLLLAEDVQRLVFDDSHQIVAEMSLFVGRVVKGRKASCQGDQRVLKDGVGIQIGEVGVNESKNGPLVGVVETIPLIVRRRGGERM